MHSHEQSKDQYPNSSRKLLLRFRNHRYSKLLVLLLTALLVIWFLVPNLNTNVKSDRLRNSLYDQSVTNAQTPQSNVTNASERTNPVLPILIKERIRSDPPPKWCADLMAAPRGRKTAKSIGDCQRGRYDALCEDNKPRFFGQLNQVRMLLSPHSDRILNVVEME